jgi:Ala-tRNA(Pro) deacylase
MPASPEQLFERLKELGIRTETTEHPPVFTVEEARSLRGEIEGAHTKNLFLKDKKDVLWLIVCLEDAEIDLKSLHHRIGSARLSFGKADLLRETLGVEPGSVTPFGLINDRERRVNVVLEEAMMGKGKLNFHPLRNTATSTIAAADLERFVWACGHEPRILRLG